MRIDRTCVLPRPGPALPGITGCKREFCTPSPAPVQRAPRSPNTCRTGMMPRPPARKADSPNPQNPRPLRQKPSSRMTSLTTSERIVGRIIIRQSRNYFHSGAKAHETGTSRPCVKVSGQRFGRLPLPQLTFIPCTHRAVSPWPLLTAETASAFMSRIITLPDVDPSSGFTRRSRRRVALSTTMNRSKRAEAFPGGNIPPGR